MAEESGKEKLTTKQSILRRGIKGLLIGLGSLLLLLLILIFGVLKLPFVQEKVVEMALTYVRGKVNTEVSLDRIVLDFPTSLVLEGVYVEDQQQDTLLAVDRLEAAMGVRSLWMKKISVSEINLQGVTAHVALREDSTFNFDYLVEAFASEDTVVVEEDTTAVIPIIRIGETNLEDIYLTYGDSVLGEEAVLRLGSFQIGASTIDLNAPYYGVGEMILSNTTASYIRYGTATVVEKPVEEETDSLGLDIGVLLNDIQVINTSLLYEDVMAAQYAQIEIGEFLLSPEAIDLKNQVIAIDKVALTESKVGFTMKSDTLATEQVPDSGTTAFTGFTAGWTVSVAQVSLADNQLQFDDLLYPTLEEGMDFSHINLSKVHLEVKDILAKDKEVRLDLRKTSLKEKSGFYLKNLSGVIDVYEDHLKVDNNIIAFGKSYLEQDLLLKFPNIYNIPNELTSLYIDYHMDTLSFDGRDAQPFTATLEDIPYLEVLDSLRIASSLEVKGYLNKLEFKHFALAERDRLSFQSRMTLEGLPEADSLEYLLFIDSLGLKPKEVMVILPDSMQVEGVNLPSWASLKGQVEGSLTDIATILQLNMDMGAVYADFHMSDLEQYEGSVKVGDLQVGKLLDDPTIGPLTATFTLEGKGLDIEKELSTQFDLMLEEATYEGYTYRDLTVTGSSERLAAKVHAFMDRPEIAFDIGLEADLNKEEPTVGLHVNLKKAYLQQLNLMEDTVYVEGQVYGGIIGIDPEDMALDVVIEDFVFQRGTVPYAFDRMTLSGTLTPDSANAIFTSDILDLSFSSNVPLDSLTDLMTHRLNSYFSLDTTLVKKRVAYEDTHIEFKMIPKDTYYLTEGLIPGLTEITLEPMNGYYDNEEDALLLHMMVPHVVYNDIQVDSLGMDVIADTSHLEASFFMSKLAPSDSIELNNFSIDITAKDEIVDIGVFGENKDKTDYWLKVISDMENRDGIYVLSFDSLRLNKTDWKVSPNNEVRFGQGVPFIDQFQMQSKQGTLKLQTVVQGVDSTLRVNLEDVDFSTITYSSERENSLLMGVLDTEVDYRYDGQLQTKVEWTKLGALGHEVGTLTLEANNDDKLEKYAFNTALKGLIGDIQLQGSYDLSEEKVPLNLEVAVEELSLEPLEPFVQEYLTELGGGFEGDIQVKGLGTAPLFVRGQLEMDQMYMRLFMTGSRFDVAKGTIGFDEKGITLNHIEVHDPSGNDLDIHGRLETQDFLDYRFKIDITCDDFEVVNSKEPLEGQELYGLLVVDNATKIRGTLDHPVITSTINVDRKTDLFYVYLEGGVAALDQGEGVVEFIDISRPIDTLVVQDTNPYLLDVKSKITIQKGTKVTVILDPEAGDALEQTGGGELNFSMQSGGDMVMTGAYEIESGTYGMTFYKVIPKKEFYMRPGSRIFWTGDPMAPTADISAIYRAKTPPYPLLANRVSDPDRYKARKAFDVYLNLEGEVMNPDISFNITYPESVNGKDSNIERVLTEMREDEGQMNKQVFSLLMVGSFINVSGGDANTGEEIVRGTISSMISNQLNKLSSEYVKGVDLSFNLDSYDKTGGGTQTDVGVKVKKSLFNDRLSVSVGGTYMNSEEAANANQSNEGTFYADFELLYKILRDGTLQGKLFRERDKEYFTPDVQKTGFSLMYDKKYNKFKELFEKNLEKKQERRRMQGRMKRTDMGGRKKAEPAKTEDKKKVPPKEDDTKPTDDQPLIDKENEETIIQEEE
ncbi:translocation/assembly module TamB domain-containing protein [Algivirga pacifica]|uniref:Translocation and assembly module TamB C-terminal domain-containing protein n=1 Tax=Algivirga pacifica TaxID=1162670 RepID=A0ABP9CY52_9BACT